MRRVQSNLTYLTALADRSEPSSDTTPDRPTILTSIPANLPGNAMSTEGLQGLEALYAKLRKLWPAPGPANGVKAEANGSTAAAKAGAATASARSGQGQRPAAAKMPPPTKGAQGAVGVPAG